MFTLGVSSVMIYGATAAAEALVDATVAANSALYGQGPEGSFAPPEDRIRAGLALLTEHGFRLPHLHDEHPRIELPGVRGGPPGFGYEQKVIPDGVRFSGLRHDRLRQYRPDDARDYRQFEAARREADNLGYQFYRAEAPFGAALFIVDGFIPEPDMTDRLLEKQGGYVRLYNPYNDLDSRGEPLPHRTALMSIRKYMDRNPEFARFAGFTSGWRSKPKFRWSRWEILQAHSDMAGFTVDGESVWSGWRLDSEFGMQILVSSEKTAIVSLTHPETGRRAFLTFREADAQVDLKTLPDLFEPEIRGTEGSTPREATDLNLYNVRPGYILDPEDWIFARPSMLIKMGGMGASIRIPRASF